MLARAMAGCPQLLLLDEPTAGVDANRVEMLYELLRKLMSISCDDSYDYAWRFGKLFRSKPNFKTAGRETGNTMSMLEYSFMQRAFLTGILLAVITPLIGMTIVLKRMSMIGDALSHASLAGVALGLILGINPVAGGMCVCVTAALTMEGIRRKLPRYAEMSTAIVMSAGIGLAGVLSGAGESGANLNSFLFGSIVSISRQEMLFVCGISLLVLLSVLLL